MMIMWAAMLLVCCESATERLIAYSASPPCFGAVPPGPMQVHWQIFIVQIMTC
jgi:hypothetical protein